MIAFNKLKPETKGMIFLGMGVFCMLLAIYLMSITPQCYGCTYTKRTGENMFTLEGNCSEVIPTFKNETAGISMDKFVYNKMNVTEVTMTNFTITGIASGRTQAVQECPTSTTLECPPQQTCTCPACTITPCPTYTISPQTEHQLLNIRPRQNGVAAYSGGCFYCLREAWQILDLPNRPKYNLDEPINPKTWYQIPDYTNETVICFPKLDRHKEEFYMNPDYWQQTIINETTVKIWKTNMTNGIMNWTNQTLQ